MALPPELFSAASHWLDEAAPANQVVVSSRARYARNVAGHVFSPHGSPRAHHEVHAYITDSLARNASFEDLFRLDLGQTSGTERAFLKERRLISKEMERGGDHRSVYLGPQLKTAIMVNEEDHLRLQCLEPGLQLGRAHTSLDRLEGEIAAVLQYAWHQRFGFLTACPSNVGTGLRASVMLHLPALTMRRRVQAAFQGNAERGLTLRGFYGENTEATGEFYQLSNEVTLGLSVDDIFERLIEVVHTVMAQELEARSLLLKEEGVAVEDAVWRSYGVLTHARRLSSAEAMTMLSRMRLGIDEGWFPGVTHALLNRLVMEIQPGHLVHCHGGGEETDQRDAARARLVQSYLPRI